MARPELKQAYLRSVKLEKSGRKYQEKDILLELWMLLKKIFKKKRQK